MIGAALRVLFIYFCAGVVVSEQQKGWSELFRVNLLEGNHKPSIPIFVLIGMWAKVDRATASVINCDHAFRCVCFQVSSACNIWYSLRSSRGGFRWPSIAISFILSLHTAWDVPQTKQVIALRLQRTIRRYVWSFIVAGVILQIFQASRWVKAPSVQLDLQRSILWLVLVTISVLRLWRAKVFNSLEHISDRPVWRCTGPWIAKIPFTYHRDCAWYCLVECLSLPASHHVAAFELHSIQSS